MRFSSRLDAEKMIQDIENIEVFEGARQAWRFAPDASSRVLGIHECIHKGRMKVSALYDKPNISGLDDFIISTERNLVRGCFPSTVGLDSV